MMIIYCHLFTEFICIFWVYSVGARYELRENERCRIAKQGE